MEHPAPLRHPKLLVLINESLTFRAHFFQLTKWAQELGFEVTVATQFRGDEDVFRQAGFRTAPLSLNRRGMNPFAELWTLGQIVRTLRRERPDVVEAVTIKPVLYGGVAALATGTRSVVHFLPGLGHLFISPRLAIRLLRPFLGLAFRRLLPLPSSRLLVMNDDDARELTDRVPALRGKIEVVRGVGVDLNRFKVLPEPAGPLAVACVSRMLWDKGIAELVAASRLLRERGHAVRIDLVGSTDPGNPTSIPGAQLDAWHREGLINYRGFVPELSDVWRTAHVCVLPSYREGLPMSLVEAAAFGRALIGTDVPGCRDVIQHLATGLLVAPRSAEALADAIQQYLLDEGLRHRLASAARRAVEERYSTPVIRAQMERIYRSAASSAGEHAAVALTAGPERKAP